MTDQWIFFGTIEDVQLFEKVDSNDQMYFAASLYEGIT